MIVTGTPSSGLSGVPDAQRAAEAAAWAIRAGSSTMNGTALIRPFTFVICVSVADTASAGVMSPER
ncbi:MAG TPA: hypothetical protein VF444_11485 [Pseudonocardiaceae bacterium]